MSLMFTPPLTRNPSPKDGIKARRASASLTSTTTSDWQRLQELLGGEQCNIDGESLDIAGIVAVAKYVIQTRRRALI